MKNGCQNSDAEIADRNERAKKLYRYVSDVSRRIDEAVTGSRSIADLFTTNLEVQRQKLRDNCEKLMFLDLVNYGKRSLELLWRKVYYETVSASKKLHNSDEEYDNFLFTHIMCGIGHFQHFITRIQAEMKLQIKELDYIPLHNDEETENATECNIDNEVCQVARSLLHSCLIYLGDLSRYEAEIFHTFDPTIAARYYLQASQLDLSSGMPFNQLGNLHMDKNHNLDSICYYIHCLNCALPFDGAMGNLTKLFEKNAQYLESAEHSGELSQGEQIQDALSRFLALVEVWYLGKDDSEVPTNCSLVVHALKVTLDFKKPSNLDILANSSNNDLMHSLDELINPTYMNANIIHKIVQISLFTVAKMCEADEKGAFAAKAFTLALLSQLLQKLLQQLLDYGLKNPASKYFRHHSDATNVTIVKEIKDENENSEEAVIIENGIEEQPSDVTNGVIEAEDTNPDGIVQLNIKKLSTKRRRRRKVASSESSDLSGSETETSSVELQSSSDESDSSDSGASKSEASDIDDDNKLTSKKEVNGEVKEIIREKYETDKSVHVDDTKSKITNKSIDDKKQANSYLDSDNIQNFLRGDNFLPSIKLLQDWALTEKELILSCGESGESLFQCVVDLLNMFEYNFKFKKQPNPHAQSSRVLDYAKSVAKKMEFEYKQIPLPEDVNLRGTGICKYDKDAAEWLVLNHYKPSNYEENVIRILNFIDFGHQIANIVPRIRYNRTMQIFYLKKISAPKLTTKINHKRTREWHTSKKQHVEGAEGGLLRRLGQLWLASRVRELERWGRADAGPTLLALDAAALHTHLHKVKQLLRSRSYLMLVPTVVLQELDELKREMSGARDAIRWLETQLQSGSRFLRAQRPGQARSLPLLRYPRKAPTHVHNFIQILEFCYHLIAEEKQPEGVGGGGGGEPESAVQAKATPLLVLLTGTEPGSVDDQYKEFSVTGAAHAAGISVQCVGDFYAKWRQTAHKAGKKR